MQRISSKREVFGLGLVKTNLEISALISFATLLAKESSKVWKPEFIEEFIMSPISEVSWNRSKKQTNIWVERKHDTDISCLCWPGPQVGDFWTELWSVHHSEWLWFLWQSWSQWPVLQLQRGQEGHHQGLSWEGAGVLEIFKIVHMENGCRGRAGTGFFTTHGLVQGTIEMTTYKKIKYLLIRFWLVHRVLS